MNITTGMKQLFTRTPDECVKDMDDMVSRLEDREARTQIVDVRDIKVEPTENALRVKVRTGDMGLEGSGTLNHTSAQQLASMAGGGFGVLNQLSPETASLAYNELIKAKGVNNKGYRINALTTPDTVQIRSFYSDRYQRVSDMDTAKHFRSLASNYGYEPAGTFAGKRGGLPPLRPDYSGLYVGEHDIFGFLANESAPVETRNDSALYSAIIFGNSECKTSTIYWMHVYYEFICGNMQLWNVGYTNEARQKHVGDPHQVLHRATEAFQKAEADQISHRDVVYQKVKATQRKAFADTRKKAQKKLEGYLNKRRASDALDFIDHPRAYPENPLSVYGVGQAVTLYSQTFRNADERLAIDRIGGQILNSVTV